MRIYLLIVCFLVLSVYGCGKKAPPVPPDEVFQGERLFSCPLSQRVLD